MGYTDEGQQPTRSNFIILSMAPHRNDISGNISIWVWPLHGLFILLMFLVTLEVRRMLKLITLLFCQFYRS